jgi:predicted DNA-binding transcriptional regulator AlpA
MVDLLRLPKVCAQTGMSPSQVYEEVRKGNLAAPTKLFEGARAQAWFSDEIDRYVEQRRKARDETLAAVARGELVKLDSGLWGPASAASNKRPRRRKLAVTP